MHYVLRAAKYKYLLPLVHSMHGIEYEERDILENIRLCKCKDNNCDIFRIIYILRQNSMRNVVNQCHSKMV